MTGGWLHGSAEFPTLLFLPFSLSPGPAERVRRRVWSLEAEKERNFLHFLRGFFVLFFVSGILPVFTNRCCLSFARQALSRFYGLNRLFALISSAR